MLRVEAHTFQAAWGARRLLLVLLYADAGAGFDAPPIDHQKHTQHAQAAHREPEMLSLVYNVVGLTHRSVWLAELV